MSACCEYPGCTSIASAGTTGSPWWFTCHTHNGWLRPTDPERLRIEAPLRTQLALAEDLARAVETSRHPHTTNMAVRDALRAFRAGQETKT